MEISFIPHVCKYRAIIDANLLTRIVRDLQDDFPFLVKDSKSDRILFKMIGSRIIN